MWNVETNVDVAFYNSINGNVVTQTTNSGINLYTYSVMKNLFSNSLAVANVDVIAASVGSECSNGYYGDSDFPNCKSCPVG